MRWRKRVWGETIPELTERAAQSFPPGTTYSITVEQYDGIRGIRPARTRYRAEALTDGTVGPHRTPLVSHNPEKVTLIPTWRPETVPPQALQATTDRSAALNLLQEGPGAPAATSHPQVEQILDRLGQGSAERHPPILYVGLADDPIQAAAYSGHRSWSGAGALDGGRAGSEVICYGLGDGTALESLIDGIGRIGAESALVAVDPARKHADTQHWVDKVQCAIPIKSLILVHSVHTLSPSTVHQLGHPVSDPRTQLL